MMQRLYVKILLILSLVIIYSESSPLFAQEKDSISSTIPLDEVIVRADRVRRETIPLRLYPVKLLKS